MSERSAFVIDLNRCTGCRACELACVIANKLPPDRAWREVRDYNESHVPGVESFHLSLACNHCEQAPCMEQCPARAYYRDPVTAAVLIDDTKCIGCGYCAWICPWDAPRLDETRGVMTKCTFCSERLGEGRVPACVTGCPTAALGWVGELGEESLPAVPGFALADTGPAVQLVPLADSRKLPESTVPPAMPPWREAFRRLVLRITLSGEWPLALFTFLLALLVGFFTASRFGAPSPGWGLFAGAGAAGLLLSAAHLGRKGRAWRAGLHADRSWLSREVLFYGAFLATGTVVLLNGEGIPWLGWTAALLGLGAAMSADMVYRVARMRGSSALHSALTLPTALLIAAMVAGAVKAALIISTLKMALYVARKVARRRQGLDIRPLATVLRTTMLAAGSTWLALNPGQVPLAALLLITASELVDRLEYYDELEISTPASLMLDDLEKRVG
jgi:Fe-S-cluster-containing dehydrogenase component/DMSO reductase anchor subunit